MTVRSLHLLSWLVPQQRLEARKLEHLEVETKVGKCWVAQVTRLQYKEENSDSIMWWKGVLPWWLSSKESACRCRKHVPGSGRSPGGGNGNPLQYSRLGNSKDRGARRAGVHGVTKELDHTFHMWYFELCKKNTIWPVLWFEIHRKTLPYRWCFLEKNVSWGMLTWWVSL